MKKTILISIIGILNMLMIPNTTKAENIGIGDIVFQDPTITSIIITHGFSLHELSYTAIKLHIFLAGKDIEILNYQGEILNTIKTLEELTKTNIITLLDLSENKKETLQKYLSTCDQILQKGNILSVHIKQEMNILKNDMEACLHDKNISDKTYFDAVKRYDQDMMKLSLLESIKHDACASEKRIKYNALINIKRKLVLYLGLLQKKYDIIFDKQNILTNNFTVFRDNILPELNEIDRFLKQYDF